MSADVPTIKTAAETALAQELRAGARRLPGDKAVAAQRDAAFDVFAKSGLPHRRVEEWKYTDLRALMRDAKPLARAAGCRRQGAAPRMPVRWSATSKRGVWFLSTAPSSRNCPTPRSWKTD